MSSEATFVREPLAYLEVLKIVLAGVAVFALPGFDADFQALVLAAVYAGVGAVQALKTKPIAPAALVAFATAAAALAARFGLDVGPEQIAVVVGLISAVAALQSRAQVSPANAYSS